MKRIIMITFLALLAPLAAFAQDTPQTFIDYNGELVDQAASPLSGVLPLEFRIYTDSKSKKPIAVEKHFVAVVDGNYAVSLGELAKITAKSEKLSVAVFLDGHELTRQDVSVLRQIVPSEPKTVTTETIGNDKGDSFKLECPSGYVVTGIEGTMKNGVQGLKLICSKAI